MEEEVLEVLEKRCELGSGKENCLGKKIVWLLGSIKCLYEVCVYIFKVRLVIMIVCFFLGSVGIE